MKKNINKLPKWVRKLISEQEQKICDHESTINRLESLLPWAENKKEWFTIKLEHDDFAFPRRLFYLFDDSAHPICSVEKGDIVIIGRNRKI